MAEANGLGGRSMGKKNRKGLTLAPAQPKPAAPSAGDSQIPGAIGNTEERKDTLEIGVEFKLDLKNEDLLVLKELGSGNGGTVSKVQHAATKDIMARKVGLLLHRSMVGHALTTATDYTCRGQARGSTADRQRAWHHVRVQLALHHLLLRRFHERQRRRRHVHGIHGLRVSLCGSLSTTRAY